MILFCRRVFFPPETSDNKGSLPLNEARNCKSPAHSPPLVTNTTLSVGSREVKEKRPFVYAGYMFSV